MIIFLFQLVSLNVTKLHNILFLEDQIPSFFKLRFWLKKQIVFFYYFFLCWAGLRKQTPFFLHMLLNKGYKLAKHMKKKKVYPTDPRHGNFLMPSRLNKFDLCGLFFWLNDNLT